MAQKEEISEVSAAQEILNSLDKLDCLAEKVEELCEHKLSKVMLKLKDVSENDIKQIKNEPYPALFLSYREKIQSIEQYLLYTERLLTAVEF